MQFTFGIIILGIWYFGSNCILYCEVIGVSMDDDVDSFEMFRNLKD